MNNANQGLKVR